MAIVGAYANEIMAKVASDVAKVTAHPDSSGQPDEATTLGTATLTFSPPSEFATTIYMAESSVDISITEPEATGVKWLMLRKSDDSPIDLKELTTAVGISGDEIEKIIRINDWVLDADTSDV